MLAHPGDEGGNNGFTTSAGTIKGSFPSPDDLLNLAPVISENLEVTAWPLIGQTILPIAYIRVRNGQVGLPDILTQDDIMDIRPFFRTTELAYNERAGIAAATPQISIANPVVSEAHLEKVRTEIYNDLFQRIGTGGPQNPSAPPPDPNNLGSQVLAIGSILGGFNHGPEGALARQRIFQQDSAEDVKTAVELEFGYPQGRIPFGCEWDRAKWYSQAGFTDDLPCDSINVGDSQMIRHGNPQAEVLPPYNGVAPAAFANSTTGNFEGNLGSMGFPKAYRNQATSLGQASQELFNINKHNNIYFVSKKIFLNGNPYDDYKVNVQFLNCIPLTQMSNGKGSYDIPNFTAQPAGIFVIKHSSFFIINVAFVNNGLYGDYEPNSSHREVNRHQRGDYGKPWKNRESANRFSGFMLPEFNMEGATADFTNFEPRLQDEPVNGFGGASYSQSMLDYVRQGESSPKTTKDLFTPISPILYPSVTFEVVGFNRGLSNSIDLSSRFGTSVINL